MNSIIIFALGRISKTQNLATYDLAPPRTRFKSTNPRYEFFVDTYALLGRHLLLFADLSLRLVASVESGGRDLESIAGGLVKLRITVIQIYLVLVALSNYFSLSLR